MIVRLVSLHSHFISACVKNYLSLSLCRRFTLLLVDEDGFWFNDVDYFDWPCTFSILFLKNVYTGILVTPQTEIHTGILVAYVEY